MMMKYILLQSCAELNVLSLKMGILHCLFLCWVLISVFGHQLVVYESSHSQLCSVSMLCMLNAGRALLAVYSQQPSYDICFIGQLDIIQDLACSMHAKCWH